MGPGGTMSVTPLGVSSGPRERSAQPHELSTSTELRVVRQPPSGVSRRREALAVAVPTLLLGLAVALVDGLTLLPLACAVLCAGLAGLRTPEPGRGHTARTLVRADSATAGLLGLGLAVAGVAELVSLTDVRWGLAVVATSLVASAALRFLRVPEGSMRRVVLVGAREDIETYTSAVRNPGLLVAGGSVLEAALSGVGRGARRDGSTRTTWCRCAPCTAPRGNGDPIDERVDFFFEVRTWRGEPRLVGGGQGGRPAVVGRWTRCRPPGGAAPSCSCSTGSATAA